MFKNLNDFDFSINPADNFYYFCNGNWLENQTIPKKYTSWGTFEILFERIFATNSKQHSKQHSKEHPK